MADVRAVHMFPAGAAGTQGILLHVLHGVRSPLAAAAPHHAATLAAACALVAMRPCAATNIRRINIRSLSLDLYRAWLQ